MENKNKMRSEFRIIKTARDMDSINLAARNGFIPLIKKVEPSNDIRLRYSVLQNKKTKEIDVIGDVRSNMFNEYEGYNTVIDWTFYYPYHFKSPFAAYLIPSDIKKGERVFIEDLIEDLIDGIHNGDRWRLESCEAVWNGKELEIDYKLTDIKNWVG